jgi:hypothetical protein
MTRITAASPEPLSSDSNNLAMCLGFSVADGLTFSNLNWQDADGVLYACASWEASDAWLEKAQAPLVRPAWDVDNYIDMEAAERAQAVMVISADAIPASTTALIAISGMQALDAIAAMGLTVVPEPEAE